MYVAKRFLAGIVLLMLAVNIVDAKEAGPISSQYGKSLDLSEPPISVYEPVLMNIEAINTLGTAAGNSNFVAFSLDISQSGSNICGLDNTNFMLETLSVPSGGPGVHIRSVYETLNGCDYIFSIIPDQICKDSTNGPVKVPGPCKQLNWMPGAYTLRLYYIKDGKEITSADINFSIGSIGGKGVSDQTFHRVDEPGSRRGLVP